MLDYINFLGEYINIFTIIWGGIKLALGVFFCSIIILFIFRKYILVCRRYSILKYIAYSYYFFIPVICLCFAFVYGALTTMRDDIVSRLPTYQIVLQKFSEQYFDANISIYIDSDKNLDQILDESVTNVTGELKSKFSVITSDNNSAGKMILMIIESPVGITYIKSRLKGEIANRIKTDITLVNKIFTLRISELITGSFIIDITKYHIHQIIKGFLIQLIVLWFVLMLIPLVEILFSNRYNKKYQTKLKQDYT